MLAFQSLEHQLERQNLPLNKSEPEKALFFFWRSVFRKKTRPPFKISNYETPTD